MSWSSVLSLPLCGWSEKIQRGNEKWARKMRTKAQERKTPSKQSAIKTPQGLLCSDRSLKSSFQMWVEVSIAAREKENRKILHFDTLSFESFEDLCCEFWVKFSIFEPPNFEITTFWRFLLCILGSIFTPQKNLEIATLFHRREVSVKPGAVGWGLFPKIFRNQDLQSGKWSSVPK